MRKLTAMVNLDLTESDAATTATWRITSPGTAQRRPRREHWQHLLTQVNCLHRIPGAPSPLPTIPPWTYDPPPGLWIQEQLIMSQMMNLISLLPLHVLGL
ncbi:hypothetical protein NDA11_002920 [Ustilago hordei]|uniref:Uncharacterized protein n=1 Tax=Ustilago hordei TaxID=120017 RepID=I2FV85_USTHO|nr:hypothetical protein NDA10_005512 [Ustilago hordei]KAJ1576326.1 hypothetical protein NDA12_001562 [Ustilago hordei]KAJ1577925.1 hypothetical protein NDA15_007205 [Ustilago hordei]KAJ1596842.1 hypothetical protein NDA11_002920 [Ustilago hordei]KAJ1598950.1 hypothetical protein NDA14_006154 [Ustilago hordei]